MMRVYGFTMAVAIIAVLISSGCLGYNSMEMNETAQAGEGEALTHAQAAEAAVISVMNLSTDKEVYHSSDVMNLSITIDSSSDLEGVQLTAKGIKNKMNMMKTVNLSEGENTFNFIYKLPTCNVCGGISAGTYDVQCEVIHGNTTLKNTTSVELRQ